MSIRYEYPTTLDRDDFDRLFAEALPYISVEKVRIGGEAKLKQALWELFDGAIPRTKVLNYYEPLAGSNSEEYIVGSGAGMPVKYNNEMWFWLQTPLWGSDQNNSKSWWFSEDTRRMQRDHLIENDFVGVVCIYNPGSPAGNAVFNNFADSWDGRQYFDQPVQVEVDDVFGQGVIGNITDTMKVVVARARS